MLAARSKSRLLSRRLYSTRPRQSLRKASDRSLTDDRSKAEQSVPLVRTHSVHPDKPRWEAQNDGDGSIARKSSSTDSRSRKSVASLVEDLGLYEGQKGEESWTKSSQTGRVRRGDRYVRKQSQTGQQEGTGTLIRKHPRLDPYVEPARVTNPEPTGPHIRKTRFDSTSPCIRKIGSDSTRSIQRTSPVRYVDYPREDLYGRLVGDLWINSLSSADIPVDTYKDVSEAERPVSGLLRNILTKSVPTDWTPSLAKHVPNWMFWKSWRRWAAFEPEDTINDLSTDSKVFVQRSLEPPRVHEHPNLRGWNRLDISYPSVFNSISPDLPVEFYIHAKPKGQQELYPRELGFQLYKAFKICPNIVSTTGPKTRNRRIASSHNPTEQDSTEAKF